MNDAVERLVNLGLYLADAREPVTAERIRADVAGYPGEDEQDQAAFLRMFERDKDLLRAAGFAILTDAENEGLYRLDRAATFSASIELSAEETAAIRAAGTALLGDRSFPFAEDLRLALAKIGSALDSGDVPAAARLADEDPEHQGESVAILSDAAARSKRVAFVYTNSYNLTSPHEIEPYGLFLHDGRWYLVGRDVAKDEVRTYTVSRMSDIAPNVGKPKQPDFERPADFDVRAYTQLPFQYGPADAAFSATLRFAPHVAWRAEALTSGQGELAPAGDALVWRVDARSARRLARFVIENGPGISAVGPPAVADEIRAGLGEVARIHA